MTDAPLTLHDTMEGGKRPFVPADPSRVTMYVCGPTVYNYAHIGNARPPVVFDVLFRLLRHVYGADAVVYARNITDVDDKSIEAARETGAEIGAITDKFAAIYREDTAALGVLPPTLEPHATAHVEGMISLIGRLIDEGAAYAAEGHVLFSVAAFARYGALSRVDRDEMIAGARVEVAPYKKNAADFVLWKPASDGEPGWESPWGRGRPGWHTECSAMIETVLGETIDIHGGGHDLRFPHHENEIAQSACVHSGAPLARFWLHNGFLRMGTEKMSKSLGNVVLIHDLLKRWPGEAVRWALLSAHYRQPLEWTEALLEQSKATLDRLYRALSVRPDISPVTNAGISNTILEPLYQDLMTPVALSNLSLIARAVHGAVAKMEDGDDSSSELNDEIALGKGRLLASAQFLGFLTSDPSEWFRGDAGEGPSDEEIDRLLTERAEARKRKDFATADRIRDHLAAQGIVIEDGAGGASWRRA